MNKKTILNLLSVSLSVFVTISIVFIFLLILGKDPFQIFGLIFSEVFADGYGIGQTLFKATPLIFVSCGLAVCFHASLFNIGAEGQLNAGAFIIAVAALKLEFLPFPLAIFISLVCGFLVSGFFGLIPAYIKIKKDVSEVITTIMMNFVILALVNFFLLDFFGVESTMRTEKINEDMMFMKFGDIIPYFQGSTLNTSFIIALLFAFLTYIFIYKTGFGYKLRAVGFNELASKYLGIRKNGIILLSFFTGAGITSFAGMNYIFGYKGFYEFGFSNNIGFTAIAVTLLARNNPIGIIFASMLFAILDYGGLSVNQLVPKELMLVVQGIIILSLLAVDKIVSNYFKEKILT